MRRLAIIIISIICAILLDFGSKLYMDSIVWQKYCYPDSPYIAQNIDNRLQAICNRDWNTGQYFYDSVYKDIYSPIFGEYLGLRLSYNSGVAFSLPVTGLPLQMITIILVLGLFWYYFYIEYPKKSKLLDAAYILIIAGAVSHAYERIFVGHVIDFIAVKYFAILNFADIFISIGAILIFYVYYVTKQ